MTLMTSTIPMRWICSRRKRTQMMTLRLLKKLKEGMMRLWSSSWKWLWIKNTTNARRLWLSLKRRRREMKKGSESSWKSWTNKWTRRGNKGWKFWRRSWMILYKMMRCMQMPGFRSYTMTLRSQISCINFWMIESVEIQNTIIIIRRFPL